MIDNSIPREGHSADTQQQQQQQQQDSAEARAALAETAVADNARDHRASYATRLRMILLLSLGSWALLIAAIAWLAGLL